MKKYLIVLGFTLIVPSVASASFDASLSYGSSGNDVQQLQEFLVSQGCLSVQATGYFGSLTLAAVKCFQDKYGLPDTGYFGSMSRTEANTLLGAAASSSADADQPSCPAGWTCTPGASQAVNSSVDMSEGVNAAPALSPLVGSGSTLPSLSPTSAVPLSPLIGSASVSPAVSYNANSTSTSSSSLPVQHIQSSINMSEGVNATPPLSPLIQ